MIFVGPDFVVTVRHGEHGGLAGVRKRIDASPAILKLGPYAIMHAIADHVVDSYLDVTDLIETDIDAMEEDIFSPLTQTNIECIYLLKREVVELRRAVAPLTLALQRIGTDHNDLISIEVRRYMRDVLDHNIQASDRITSYDEMLSSLVQAALGKVAMQQNIDMRKISAWVAIAAVPTAMAGIYGMNFDHMPELHQVWGYPAVLRRDGGRLRAVVPDVPAQPLALTRPSRAQVGLAPLRRCVGIEHVDAVLLPRLPHGVGALEPHPRGLGGGDRRGGQDRDRRQRRGQRNVVNVAAAQQKRGERRADPTAATRDRSARRVRGSGLRRRAPPPRSPATGPGRSAMARAMRRPLRRADRAARRSPSRSGRTSDGANSQATHSD